MSITLDEIKAAAERIGPYANRTPVVTSRTLDARTGARVLMKCEQFQRGGAFKFRGAMNAVLQLNEAERAVGVVTHSSGNHAQALALAGRLAGVAVTVVMPTNAPASKRAATEEYGAEVLPCEPTLAARESAVNKLIAERGLTLVHPFNDWRVIAGQGTAALELIEDFGPFDAILVPCGGGGLLSGTAIAATGHGSATKVYGVEPEPADDARRSLKAGVILPSGDPQTIADGLRTSLGPKTFAVIRERVAGILIAPEGAILDAVRFAWERLKLVIEPSAAVPLVPLLDRSFPADGLRVGVILSGGNLDLDPVFRALGGGSEPR